MTRRGDARQGKTRQNLFVEVLVSLVDVVHILIRLGLGLGVRVRVRVRVRVKVRVKGTSESWMARLLPLVNKDRDRGNVKDKVKDNAEDEGTYGEK
jgi:hypothetical protein